MEKVLRLLKEEVDLSIRVILPMGLNQVPTQSTPGLIILFMIDIKEDLVIIGYLAEENFGRKMVR